MSKRDIGFPRFTALDATLDRMNMELSMKEADLASAKRIMDEYQKDATYQRGVIDALRARCEAAEAKIVALKVKLNRANRTNKKLYAVAYPMRGQ